MSAEVLRVVGKEENKLGVRAGAVAPVLDELARYWWVVEPVGEIISKCRKRIVVMLSHRRRLWAF